MEGDGGLVLVVGPSGAGKDTLLRHAADKLAGDERFAFPQRLVTRRPDAAHEDHAAISRTEFERLRACGDYALCWEAHGLGYIIPKQVEVMIRAGRIAVCNGSRRIITDAATRFPDRRIISVEADPKVRAARLLARGRETRAAIEERLRREVPTPADPEIAHIDNSQDLGSAARAFVRALERIESGWRGG